MGPLGTQEMIFIFILALLIFGPKKLPELGRNFAKALAEFRRASSDLKATFDREMSNLERETESLKEVTQSYQNEITSSYYGSEDSYRYDDSSYYDSGAYGAESYDSSATNPSSVSASATQGAESTTDAATAEGVAPAEGNGTDSSEVAAVVSAPEGESSLGSVSQPPANGSGASEQRTVAT